MFQKGELDGLERKLQRIVSAQRSPSRVRVTPVAGSDSIKAAIHLHTKEIQFQPAVEWDLTKYDRIARFARRLGIASPEVKTCSDVSLHEVGHNKLRNDEKGLGCPVDVKGREITIEAVSKALAEEGKFSQGGALYLDNLIEDLVNNTNASRFSKYNGMAMYFADQGEKSGGTYSPLFGAYVKLNMLLWGTRRQKAFLKPYYPDSKEMDEAVEGCMRDVRLTDQKEQNLRILFNQNDWSRVFYAFAKRLAKLMDRNSPEWLPGSGSGGKGYEVPPEGFSREARFDPDMVGDPGMKEVLDPDNMKRMMMRRNARGEAAPMFVENWRALDYLYKGLASEIRIKAESPKKGSAMPIAPIQARPFDRDKDRLEDILFGKILLDEDGKPCLSVPRSHVQHRVQYKKTVKSYPELNIAILDTSVSMKEAANSRGVGRTNVIPWGDNSKYHYALTAYYGTEKALHRMGVALKTRYRLVTFAEKTEATPELGYEDKSKMKEKMLNPNFGGNTRLDVQVLAKSARQPGSVLMTISDGAIWNWSTIKEDFRKVIADKHYVHFQIGGETETSRDLKSWGATVIQISDASEMPKRAIDITKRFYKSCMQGDEQR